MAAGASNRFGRLQVEPDGEVMATPVVLTDSISTIGQYLFSMLDSNRVDLGLKGVWYGDQEKIPETPAACVEMGLKRRELNGTPRRTLVVIDAYIILYHERISDEQENQRQSELKAEQVENLIHQDPQLGGLVVHSLITSSEPGYVQRGGAKVKASRLTVECTSQKVLPSFSN